MKNRITHISLFVFFILLTFKAIAQTDNDKVVIYKLVLQEFIDSNQYQIGLNAKQIKKSFPLCLLDSTCTTSYPSIVKDSVCRKYFKINENNKEKMIFIARDFFEFTKQHVKIPHNILPNKSFKFFKTVDFDIIFNPCRINPEPAEKCWKKFRRKSKAKGFCRFSTPYFYNSEIALIYFSHSYGPLCGNGCVYLVVKENNIWKIKSRIWQWIS
jgi:hypothetical protein